jgi:hypothetical protein
VTSAEDFGQNPWRDLLMTRRPILCGSQADEPGTPAGIFALVIMAGRAFAVRCLFFAFGPRPCNRPIITRRTAVVRALAAHSDCF